MGGMERRNATGFIHSWRMRSIEPLQFLPQAPGDMQEFYKHLPYPGIEGHICACVTPEAIIQAQ